MKLCRSTVRCGEPADDFQERQRNAGAAGAVVVGLTNVPELCVFGTTDGVHGTARNPWDPSRSAGGSSGGSAAAVAAAQKLADELVTCRGVKNGKLNLTASAMPPLL